MHNLFYSALLKRTAQGLAEAWGVISELFLLVATLASALLLVTTVWCLAASLRFATRFSIADGPFSNWLVWSYVAATAEAGKRLAQRRAEIAGAMAFVSRRSGGFERRIR